MRHAGSAAAPALRSSSISLDRVIFSASSASRAEGAEARDRRLRRREVAVRPQAAITGIIVLIAVIRPTPPAADAPVGNGAGRCWPHTLCMLTSGGSVILLLACPCVERLAVLVALVHAHNRRGGGCCSRRQRGSGGQRS